MSFTIKGWGYRFIFGKVNPPKSHINPFEEFIDGLTDDPSIGDTINVYCPICEAVPGEHCNTNIPKLLHIGRMRLINEELNQKINQFPEY